MSLDVKIVRKIPLENLINYLMELYDVGVNYIDIEGTQGDTSDIMGISFCKDYMDEEFQDNFDHLEDEDVIEGTPFDPNNIDDII